MGIINGKEFIDRLNKLENEIWYDGEKLEGNISDHPAFKGIVKTKSSLYDLQMKDFPLGVGFNNEFIRNKANTLRKILFRRSYSDFKQTVH